MKVAVVCPYDLAAPGGVQDQAIGIAAHLGAAGHQAWLVGPGEEGPPGSRLVGGATRIPANGAVAPIALRPAVWRAVREAVEGADVLHIHEPFQPLVSWAALASGIPALGTLHAGPPAWVRTGYRLGKHQLGRFARRLGDVTAVSPVAAAPLAPVLGDVQIVPNGIDLGYFKSDIERHPRRVVFLGRDEHRKGLDVLLEAWGDVLAAHPDAELHVLGADRDATDGVVYHGIVTGKPRVAHLASASIYVAPHRGAESFGITLVEAVAAGCALVASDIPPFRFVAGEAAAYFPPSDSRRLAAALIDLMGSDQARLELAEAGEERMRRFDWSVVFPQYLERLERLAGGTASKRPSTE